MATVDEVMRKLKAHAKPDQLGGMARYGMVTERRLGVSVPQMRALAKEIGHDHALALKLWQTGYAEARIVAALVADSQLVTNELMEKWVKDINSWDVCDQVCMNLFEKTPLAWQKIKDWSKRKEEFVKRTAFSLLACLAWHDKTARDEAFIKLLPLIRREAKDERNFVKKSVNWALRNIGKRNQALHTAVLACAREIQAIDHPVARWIAADAIRDLGSGAVKRRLAKKSKSEF
jgi:3-methyladenine DNA glycosylase AlkD